MRERFQHGLAHLKLPLLGLCLLLLCVSACVKLPRQIAAASKQSALFESSAATSQLLNLNTASAEELARLPGIGKGIAARIIAYRAEYGRFRRPEHLLMVRGISERRFLALRSLVTAE